MRTTFQEPDVAGRIELMERAEAAFPERCVEITESGDIHLTMSPSRRHATIARRLEHWLAGFVEDPTRVQTTGHIMTRGDGMREPDVMVFDGRELPDDWATPAEYLRLVIEINSPSNPDNDWRVKMSAYATSGIPHYWIVDADERVAMLTLGVDVDGAPAYHQLSEQRPTVDELTASRALPDGVRL
jgi:Uma2 family endonuclease